MDKRTNKNSTNESNVVFLSEETLISDKNKQSITNSEDSNSKKSIMDLLDEKSYVKKVQIIIFIFLIGILLFLFSPICKLKMIVVLGDNTLTQEELIKLGKIQTNRSIYLW